MKDLFRSAWPRGVEGGQGQPLAWRYQFVKLLVFFPFKTRTRQIWLTDWLTEYITFSAVFPNKVCVQKYWTWVLSMFAYAWNLNFSFAGDHNFKEKKCMRRDFEKIEEKKLYFQGGTVSSSQTPIEGECDGTCLSGATNTTNGIITVTKAIFKHLHCLCLFKTSQECKTALTSQY